MLEDHNTTPPEAQSERMEPALCVKRARAAVSAGDHASAYAWLKRVGDARGPYVAWASAAAALARLERLAPPPARRSVRVALAGSYTTSQLGPMLRLAALRRGV